MRPDKERKKKYALIIEITDDYDENKV